jgi:hypothetical protein
MPLSVVLHPAADLPGFLANFTEDVQRVQAFRQRRHDHAAVESLETALPGELLSSSDHKSIRDCLRRMRDVVHDAGLDGARLFCEAGGNGLNAVEIHRAVIESLTNAESPPRWAFKMRTGGKSVLSPADVAAVVTACRDAGLAWKATAGLHHPTTRQVSGHREFGFLNLFTAAVLADAHKLDAAAVAMVLTESAALRFDDDGLGWGDLRADIAQIEAARRTGLLSFGSCSFNEPRDSLRTLGLIGSGVD